MHPIEVYEEKLPRVPSRSNVSGDTVEDDFDYSRDNLYDLIEKGSGALDVLLTVAEQSQHPRAFEVVATMLKTLMEANKDLISIHKTKKELEKDDPSHSTTQPQTVNNNMFVGSTSDLQRMIEDMKKT
jgi:hypothetical protein